MSRPRSSCPPVGTQVVKVQGFGVSSRAEQDRYTWNLETLQPGLLPPSIHSLVRQAVGSLVVFAQGMANFEVLEPPNQLLRLLIQLAQFRMPHFVNALHLPHHQLRIANHLQRRDLMFCSIAKRGYQSLILGVVIGAVSEVFAKLGDRMTGRVLNGDAITGRPRVAASSTIDVGSVRGWRRFRSGEKIAGF